MTPWRIDSETAPLDHVLVCSPEHYAWQPVNSVAKRTLNDAGKPPTRADFMAQYEALTALLRDAGVLVHELPGRESHLPYQAYTRDSSQVTPWGPVITQCFRPQRRGEYAAVTEFYLETSGRPWGYITTGTLEGGDIHIIRPGLLLLGYSGDRTDEAGARQFAGWFEDAGWEVRLQPFPEHFLHLDVLFCMVADCLAVACVDVLDDDLLAWLDARGIRLIPVTYKEVMQLCCNALALGGERVISAAHAERVNAAMRAEGLEVLEAPLDLFTAGGGGVHCMTMPLSRALGGNDP